MVETGRRLELDEEETLLALGVETSAGTGSVGNLETFFFRQKKQMVFRNGCDGIFYLLTRGSEVQAPLEDMGRRGTL